MNLDKLRRQIDRIDRNIVRLLNERAKVAIEIGEVKKAGRLPVFVPAREKQVYAKVQESNAGPFPDPALRRIYREIMTASRSLEGVTKAKAPTKKRAARRK